MKIIHPKALRFKCIKCALCCGDTEKRARAILLLGIEAERIANKTRAVLESFASEISGFEPYVYIMLKKEDGKCIFLKGNMCTIYKIRPLVCRFYPFELKETENGSYTFAYTSECPGIRRGAELKRSFFVKLTRYFEKEMAKAGLHRL